MGNTSCCAKEVSETYRRGPAPTGTASYTGPSTSQGLTNSDASESPRSGKGVGPLYVCKPRERRGVADGTPAELRALGEMVLERMAEGVASDLSWFSRKTSVEIWDATKVLSRRFSAEHLSRIVSTADLPEATKQNIAAVIAANRGAMLSNAVTDLFLRVASPMDSSVPANTVIFPSLNHLMGKIATRLDGGALKGSLDCVSLVLSRCPDFEEDSRILEQAVLEDIVYEVLQHFSLAEHQEIASLGCVGIDNLGKTCAIATAIHALSATSSVRAYLLLLDEENATECNKQTVTTTALSAFLKQIWSVEHLRRGYSENPRNVIKTLETVWNGDPLSSLDVHEVFSTFLDRIHEFQKDAGHMEGGETFVSRAFYGKSSTGLECTKCKKGCAVPEPFSILSVPLEAKAGAVSLKACLDTSFAAEKVTRECPSCKHNVARKTTKVASLPKHVVVHVKRFGCTGNKIETPVRVSKKLDMAQYCTDSVSLAEKGDYSLTGVLCHFASKEGVGHYTAVTNLSHSAKFYMFDDHVVRTINVCIPRPVPFQNNKICLHFTSFVFSSQEEPPQKPYAAYYVVMYERND